MEIHPKIAEAFHSKPKMKPHGCAKGKVMGS